ncbi:hypothetical protein [Pseudanabaena sp. ABRG5-3]|nr:hypothetical protein [Pseudanabaena sp. ABRG5-3]
MKIILLSLLYFISLIAKSRVRSLVFEDADYDVRSHLETSLL